MKKIVRILVRKAQRRTFNILLDDSSDIIATESAIRHLLEEDDSNFFFEEDYRTVMFTGMGTLDQFPYKDDITNPVHRIVYDDNKIVLREMTVNELTELHTKERK
jgi:hypothetical protein